MQQDKGFFWLSSYPKSGNTWFRIFLANFLHGLPGKAVNLNDVEHLINDHIVTTRTWMDEACGFNTGLLTDDELDELNPRVYAWYGEKQETVTYHKQQKAYTYLENGESLIPQEGCLGAIYFVRNPLDIAVSLSNHFFCSLDESIQIMGDESYILRAYPLRHILLSWSMHVSSWIEAKNMNVLLLRYEDMHFNAEQAFSKAVHFLGLEVTNDSVRKAINHAQFDKLKRYEDSVGFMDKPPRLKHFFRSGKVGDWQKRLTSVQVQKIIQDHGEVMQHLGYLDKNYNPILI